jgi:hypothetical protein
MSGVAEELSNERNRASFNSREMTLALYGEEKIAIMERFDKILSNVGSMIKHLLII